MSSDSSIVSSKLTYLQTSRASPFNFQSLVVLKSAGSCLRLLSDLPFFFIIMTPNKDRITYDQQYTASYMENL